MKNIEPTSFKDILDKKKPASAPAYLWQDLALTVMKDLTVPEFKRSAVFKVCRDYSRQVVERCLADTKELCKSGEKWKYFFKTIASSRPDGN